MAGGGTAYRHLGRDSAHRQALLRNLVTSLIRDESIQTTWPKAKEAQRMAEKLITLAKKNNETSRRKIQGMLFTPQELMPKVLGELRERYADRAGGCTRVLRTEPKDTYSQAPSAILELVDGPKDMRFAVTAAAVARDRRMGVEHSRLTLKNVDKVTRYRPGGKQALEDMVKRVSKLAL
ncbi:ribosomal protein L17 [Lasiosphaeria miniovina]|uniref:Large ribosomal subunit protein bL17m n=1 Tax=Lasiosphaeria miniovina TaxID=1954250 RepID=A0AA40E944_9PEZI|nr:ribosomal protein L17 [Lasiosphaeria miniovina]KAK0728616.1 ribosomal protein L17 [Lasiosphaeria miniovina]